MSFSFNWAEELPMVVCGRGGGVVVRVLCICLWVCEVSCLRFVGAPWHHRTRHSPFYICDVCLPTAAQHGNSRTKQRTRTNQGWEFFAELHRRSQRNIKMIALKKVVRNCENPFSKAALGKRRFMSQFQTKHSYSCEENNYITIQSSLNLSFRHY